MKIEKLDNEGRGITYYQDKIMFVTNALPQEEVKLKDIEEKKKYFTATCENIENPNLHRVLPKCPYYEVCGGCNLMHMDFESQEKFKLNKVRSILKKYAGLDLDVKFIQNDKDIFYRNKITLKVEENKFGYYHAKTHRFISITSCLLAKKAIHQVVAEHDFLQIHSGEITIRTNNQEEILLSIKGDCKIISDVPSYIKGIVLNDKVIYGDAYLFDTIDTMEFKLSYNSFFQVNNFMAHRIFEILRNNLEGKNLLDLYCGVGVLGLSVASNFKQIYGIEKIKNAIRDAKENAIHNGIKNAHYYAGDTGKILGTLKVTFDSVIVDPPRSGLNKETMDSILKIHPKQIAYVSCDPMTLARDLHILKEQYEIKRIYALDMFPNSYHVECVLILCRKDSFL